MGLVAEMPPERPQMSRRDQDVDFVAEAERRRAEQKLFMKVPGSLAPIGKMEHEKAAMVSQVSDWFIKGILIAHVCM
jgi:hypothetical protein